MPRYFAMNGVPALHLSELRAGKASLDKGHAHASFGAIALAAAAGTSEFSKVNCRAAGAGLWMHSSVAADDHYGRVTGRLWKFARATFCFVVYIFRC